METWTKILRSPGDLNIDPHPFERGSFVSLRPTGTWVPEHHVVAERPFGGVSMLAQRRRTMLCLFGGSLARIHPKGLKSADKDCNYIHYSLGSAAPKGEGSWQIKVVKHRALSGPVSCQLRSPKA